VGGYPNKVHPDFNRLSVVNNFGLFTDILIRDAIEADLVHLEVIRGVDDYLFFVFEQEPRGRQRKQIWQFFLFELLPTAIGFILTVTVVVQVIQLVQFAIEFFDGEERFPADAAIVVSVCLINKAFRWPFITRFSGAAFVQIRTVVKAIMANN
jgi:hypothetical protein